MLQRTFLFCAFVCSFSPATSLGFYKAIGSRVVRPNSEYHVAISTQATSLPTSVNVSISGQSFSGKTFYVDDRIFVQPYTTKIVGLEIGDIEPGHYSLLVAGEGGVDFREHAALSYLQKSYSIFIQTDKSVYKPGDLILFRAIILNPSLKPSVTESFDVYVSDGKNNKVKQWNRAKTTTGFFNGELRLGKGPVLGDWHVTVEIGGQTSNKTVQVVEYVLPKFLVKVSAPRHVTFQENIITAQIETTYDYGKKVKGDATVTLYPTIYSGVIQPIFQNPIRKVIPIDGSATVNFDVEKELGLNDEYERTVVMDVTVEEALTGRRQNNSFEIHIHKYAYRLDLIKTADYYKPGMLYVAYIKVSDHDSAPPPGGKQNTVNVRYGYSRADEIYTEKSLKLDKFGVARLDLYPPINATNDTALRIEAEYMGLKERMAPVPAASSPSRTFLQAVLETEKPIINLDVDVLVNCSEPMKYVTFELLGRGNVLMAETYQTDLRRIYRFGFRATPAMVPVAHLLVSYTRDDGELISDSLAVEIEGLLQNFVDVQTNALEAQPETDVDLTVRAQPNSHVGILAVDENAGRLKGGYDVTRGAVSDELMTYDGAVASPYAGMTKDAKSHFFWRPGDSNPRDRFHDSGAVILTNSFVNDHRPTLEDVYLRPASYGSSTVKPDRGAGLSIHTVTRPPLAGPYAFSRIPRPVWDKPRIYLAQDVMETWLFTNFSSGYEGKTTIRRRLPGSLNTWSITGFSLNSLHGLGLTSTPKLLTVAKQFAVNIDLPHSVQRGEIIAVPVVVLNAMDRDVITEVVLHNSEQKFEFAEASNEINSTARKIELYRKKRLKVDKLGASSVSFMITPTKTGPVEIRASASVLNLQESVTKYLRVEPEGETQYNSKAVLIDLRRSQQNYMGNVTVDLPENFVAGSENIELSAVGDLLGPILINLGRSIRLPTGCGEQNLIEFVPDLIVLNYLRNTRQLTPTIEQEAIRNLETGYQTQLGYKKSDGSFRTFARVDEIGSIWITSYTVFSFIQARPYVYIDESIVGESLKWLASQQHPNGSFVEVGPVIHREAQGNPVALTAFTLMAFLENRKQSSLYTDVISKGLDYVARYLDEEQSIYAVALVSYVLQLANHPFKTNVFNLLDSRAKTTIDVKWWGEDVPPGEARNPWNHLPKSMDIETTSYALLAFLEADLVDDAIPVVNWLVNQGNNLGGFTSSQDTRVGLLALYKLVMRLSASTKMQIDFQYRKQETNTFNINQNNAMIVQKAKIGNEARVINITAQGSGIALLRLAYNYNMNVTGPWPMFTLDPQVDRNSNEHHLQLSICAAFVSRNLSSQPASNMAVMEVNLPSGFTADVDSLPSLEVSQNVRKVETKNEDTTVILYFNNLTRQDHCPTISAFRTHKVAKQKPVGVVLYDYYDSSRRARMFYKGRKATTLCDICDGEDCGNICTPTTNLQQVEEGESVSVGNLARSNVVFVVILCAKLIFD